MRSLRWAWVAGSLALAGPALASGSAAAATVLRLSATASVAVAPDLLIARLSVSARAPDAAAAAAQVNRAMTAALAAARAVAQVRAATEGYASWQHPPGGPGGAFWQANQALMLQSHDPGPLLALVGRLQARGLAVNGLDWSLSAKLRARARAQATAQALRALRARAEAAAAVLGLHFGAFRSVQLGAPPQIMPRPLFAGAALPAAPPAVAAQDISVSATVSAAATLLPGR